MVPDWSDLRFEVWIPYWTMWDLQLIIVVVLKSGHGCDARMVASWSLRSTKDSIEEYVGARMMADQMQGCQGCQQL